MRTCSLSLIHSQTARLTGDFQTGIFVYGIDSGTVYIHGINLIPFNKMYI